MQPWEEFKRKYPSGEVMYSIDGEYLGLIRINTLNVLCGYVKLPENHPYIGLDLYDIMHVNNPLYELDVHGGVTFADYIEGGCAHVGDYAIGFDCAHAGDYVPRFSDFTPLADGIWRDETFVINELKSLTEQLRGI
ncbi:hypothetical protein CYJ57_03130 [Falseniella ignava]|uniref:Uncharacterized protein n=1 Tax=Falseniella ignava TaxID=137730 RepID=A0A2I1K227_9LACT|nr:hypothetical protein [Falseniella ignava]PKY89716.1 hypothetical protein CYJ57_03130 [Falseniella ignava]